MIHQPQKFGHFGTAIIPIPIIPSDRRDALPPFERKDFRIRLMRSWSLRRSPENLVILVWPIPTLNGLV